MIKAVIFDLDLVLINALKEIFSLNDYMSKHFKIKLPKKKRLLYTLDTEAIRKRFYSKINKKEFYDYYKNRDFKDYLSSIKVHKNAREILKYLKNNKYKIALVTNRGHSTQLILNYFKIAKYFDSVLTVYDIKKPKPNPQPIIKTMKTLKVKKSEVLYVGDDIIDVRAGKGAGVSVVLYTNKFKGADYYIKDLIQIKNILEVENAR